jgi:DNA-binding LacI/PurR family transcriptional regulator
VGIPTVFGGRPVWVGPESDLAVPYVDCDNRGGARQAVRHLVSLGRQRIAHIAGPQDQTSGIDRLDGYRDVLLVVVPGLTAQGAFTAESGARAMTELLERHPDVDGVFAANDLMASGALEALREHGRRVPDDVAVVGFDDMVNVAEATDPPLTTVHQDIEGMGRLMVKVLIRGLDQERVSPPDSVIMPTELVRRVSA